MSTSPRKPASAKKIFITLFVQLHPLHIDPPIWRRILVNGDVSLRRLHHVIQAAMGWESRHLYEFTINGKRYGEPDPFQIDTSVLDDRRYKLGKLLKEGDLFRYTYDFGDDWEHVIAVEAIQDVPDPDMADACRVLFGERACPPEDVGGVPGLEDFWRKLKQPTSKEGKAALQWVGEGYDPDGFDLRQADVTVMRLVNNGWA